MGKKLAFEPKDDLDEYLEDSEIEFGQDDNENWAISLTDDELELSGHHRRENGRSSKGRGKGRRQRTRSEIYDWESLHNSDFDWSAYEE